jgi:hypothetical protein
MQNGTRLRTHALGLFTLVIAAGALVSGCGKDKNEPKYYTREGRVADINQETGVFEGWFYSHKQKQEIRLPGRLDPNVEVLINGATATVADVRIDDEVMVTVRKIKHDGESEFVATRVEVIRPPEEPVPAASAPEPVKTKPAP